MLLREEVAQLQEEVHLLRQMKDMLSKDLEETQGGCSANLLSATELRVQLSDKEQELDRAREALQGQRSTQSCAVPSFSTASREKSVIICCQPKKKKKRGRSESLVWMTSSLLE